MALKQFLENKYGEYPEAYFRIAGVNVNTYDTKNPQVVLILHAYKDKETRSKEVAEGKFTELAMDTGICVSLPTEMALEWLTQCQPIAYEGLKRLEEFKTAENV